MQIFAAVFYSVRYTFFESEPSLPEKGIIFSNDNDNNI